ncbi:hypothetical protein [Neobacillus sp. SuZ13]|uniref:hypothetical protein n=1 Tax=Neobacillus sp. SuZ13 TaxID=3047875 RepID=UPI0024BFB91F|nr:hypothetical protein [Neobacillus sp. SuZ13]WHY69349.1 hypothetical protein QNH17_12205 [Neobacillus sp. SuZ13]
MKEYTVCYTFDHEIIIEKLIKESNVKKEEVEQEVVEKLNQNKYFIVKNDQGTFKIDSSLVRFVRIIDVKILV